MKLRIQHNSIRLRLLRSEVIRLHECGRVSQSILLGPTTEDFLEYTLQTCAGETLRICRNNGALTVLLPASWATELATTERVGYDVNLSTAPGMAMRVLVEKDFQCLVKRQGEDESDGFPNPKARPGAPMREPNSGFPPRA